MIHILLLSFLARYLTTFMMWFDSVCTKLTPVGSALCISWFYVTAVHQLVQCYNCVSVGSVTTLHQLVLCNNCLLKLCFMYQQYISGGLGQFQCNHSFCGNPGLSTHTVGAISISRSIEGTSLGLWSEATIVRISQTLQRLLLPSARGD